MSSEAAFLEIVSGRRQDWQARAARLGLSCLEPLYSAGSRLKNVLFESGVKRSESAGVPVISVGNLTTGGTGKTPVVAAVVQMLVQRGMKPAIASRGYRSVDSTGNDEKRVLVFSDAGGTGRSYHADLGAKNRRLRVHYLLEAGWKADAAIQGLGRTNRTHQAQP